MSKPGYESDEEGGFRYSTMRSRNGPLGSMRGLAHLGARIGAIIMNLILVSMTGVYVNALVMDRAIDSHPIPIVGIVFFSVAELYLIAALFVYVGESTTGKRYLIMGAIDGILLVIYVLLSTKLGLDLAAISCGKQQFTATDLNRYGMGYFDYDHTLQSWAKSSYAHCQQSKAVWAVCIILSISLVTSGFLCIYTRYASSKPAKK